MGQGGLGRLQVGGDICILTADSRGCMAEANSIESNYTLVKSKFLKNPKVKQTIPPIIFLDGSSFRCAGFL